MLVSSVAASVVIFFLGIFYFRRTDGGVSQISLEKSAEERVLSAGKDSPGHSALGTTLCPSP